MKYKAVIWDCDGVLIDSENIACGISCEMFQELGCEISLEEYVTNFVGKSRKQSILELEKMFDVSLVNDFSEEKVEARQLAAFDKDLKSINGIEDVLKAVNLPMAVASGSSYNRLKHSLSVTNLTDFFDGHIYSSEMVVNGKPAPDVFLHAAEKIGVDPKDCLVVEDGVHGINAAIAAGMDVVAYLGGSHMTEGLKQSVFDVGLDNVIYDIRDLLQILDLELKEAC